MLEKEVSKWRSRTERRAQIDLSNLRLDEKGSLIGDIVFRFEIDRSYTDAYILAEVNTALLDFRDWLLSAAETGSPELAPQRKRNKARRRKR